MKYVIVGSGIAGLTLGVALRRSGNEVTILEKRADFADEGAGVVLGPNVMGALAVLDLAREVERHGREVTALNISDEKGRILARSPYRVTALPSSGRAIHRSVLHEILRNAFDGELRTNVDVSDYSFERRPTVVVGSERIESDLVIGADGIRSALRKRLSPETKLRYSGYTCFRFVADREIVGEVFEMWGRGKRVGIVPLAGGKTYVFMTLNAPPRAEKPFVSPVELASLYGEFEGPAKAAFATLGSETRVLHNDIEDGLAERFWTKGAVLIGDAAHSVTPNMGQGAGLAIEDAACLAHLLGEKGPSDEALAAYETFRKPRAHWILEQSHSLGRVAQLESSVLRALRNFALKMTPPSVNAKALNRIVTEMPGVPTHFG